MLGDHEPAKLFGQRARSGRTLSGHDVFAGLRPLALIPSFGPCAWVAGAETVLPKAACKVAHIPTNEGYLIGWGRVCQSSGTRLWQRVLGWS
jgi:hypothetical protein